MHRAVVPAVLPAILAACAPQSAELTEGSYIAFLSEGTSLSLAKEQVDPEKYDIHYNADCRAFETDEDKEALQLDNPLDVCGEETWPPLYEEWEMQAGFRVVTENLEPWRGEGLITAEGDLQIGFHHHVPGGADVRFAISIDPDFGPTRCVQGETAEDGVKREPLDGDWVAEWSKELDWIASIEDENMRAPYAHLEGLEGGKLYFLNAYSYQLNPIEPDGQLWELPETWIAGAADGKFVEEDVFLRTARYGEPSVYNLLAVEGSTSGSGTFYTGIDPESLWYCDMEEGTDPASDPCMTERLEHAREVADGIRQELELFTRVSEGDIETDDGTEKGYVSDPAADPVFSFAPIVHGNTWRIPDGRPPGLDGWTELHYNYIAFSKDSNIEVGGSAKGAFSLALDSASSSSRIFLKGKFEIPKIKRDRWTTDDLNQQKLIEAGIELCSAASESDANPSAAEK
jgi:hypothetical protein